MIARSGRPLTRRWLLGGFIVLAACGPSHMRPIPEPSAEVQTRRPLRIFVGTLTDARVIAPHREAERESACAIVRRRPPALRLGRKATDVFRDLVTVALRAKGHQIVDDPASSQVSISGSVRECQVDLHSGYMTADGVVRTSARLTIRRSSDGAVIADRQQEEEFKEELLANLKRVYLEALEHGLARFSQSLADDDNT